MLRNFTCGELNLEHCGKEAVLCGWVHSRRDHGKIIFIDLRDRYGITQIVFLPFNKDAYKIVKTLSNEDVIRVKGVVNRRPQGTENPHISTGLIEIEAKEVVVLSKSKSLPFEITSSKQISEDVRLAYRFLDLRNPKMMKNFIIRSKINKIIHRFFEEKGFIEVETPFLTKSTPEGARDFLVPSRLNPGKFYALPQSPQLFKQILMIAGVDRYYQIVRCFRDEDLRKDRQPEFTQLDFEMSFVEEKDIFTLMEDFLKILFKEIKGIDIPLPFPVMSFQEVMAKYSTDKPDLRKDKEEFSFLWVVDFPMFEWDEEEKRLQAQHHPFTSPKEEDLVFLEKEPLKVRARSYDLVINGKEIGSGSIRINDIQLQRKIFDLLNIPPEVYEERFGFLLKALEYGAPPHGGFALGLDRLCALLVGENNLREVIAFPKTQKGICLLTGAPSIVEERQLKELDIKVVE